MSYLNVIIAPNNAETAPSIMECQCSLVGAAEERIRRRKGEEGFVIAAEIGGEGERKGEKSHK